MYILSTYAYLRTSHYIFRHLENRFALVWVTLSAVCCAGLGWDWGDLIDGDESDSEDSPTFNPEGAAALEAESRNWGCLTRSRWNMLNTFIYVNTPFCWDTFYIILYNQLYNTYIHKQFFLLKLLLCSLLFFAILISVPISFPRFTFAVLLFDFLSSPCQNPQIWADCAGGMRVSL